MADAQIVKLTGVTDFGDSDISSIKNATISGDLTVSGTTTTISTTNTVVSDKLLELGNGVTGTPSGDAGVIVERGSSDNAGLIWDESTDAWIACTTAATGASSGDLTLTKATLSVSNLGVGTDAPASAIEVEGSSGDLAIEIDNNASNSANLKIVSGAGNARADFVLDGNNHLTMKAQRVGIVTTDPQKSLDVLGDGRFSTDLTVGGDVDVDGTLECDALSIDSTAITATAAELNYVDGVTSAIQTQLDSKGAAAGSSSIVTTGALNSGSITSGFGTINNGSSAITTTGTVSSGALAIGGTATLAEAKSLSIGTPLLPTTDNTSTGLTAEMLAGGAIGAFETVCIHTVTGEVVISDSDAIGTMPVIGIAPAAFNDTETGTILLQGFIRHDSWNWTIGGLLYASGATPGAMTQTAPSGTGDFVQVVGVALSDDVVYFNPSLTMVEVA